MDITTVLIDDEMPAIKMLDLLLSKYQEISVIGRFTNPLKGLDEIVVLKPQVIFLDINMPQLQGIDAASKILEVSPHTDIIFVTAYDEYAVNAFEVNALDYILKPINIERFEKTIQRIMERWALPSQKSSEKLFIRCFGKFQVYWENQAPIKWRSEKTKELFAYLLQNPGRDISKEEILDTIWPEETPDKAIKQLYNGIYYIRKALDMYGVDKSLISVSSNYNLSLGAVDSDVKRIYEFEKSSASFKLNELEEIEASYIGEYLENEDYFWAIPEREKLTSIIQICLIRLAKLYSENKEFEKTEKVLIKAYNNNSYDENIMEMLMKLYIDLGYNSKAARFFNSHYNLLD